MNFKEYEQKWKKYWDDNKTFQTDLYDFSKPKYYVLDMFPYPSGSALHVGHILGYTSTDVVARFKKLKGFNVLHPMGWDAFGLPAEQYAIDTGNHPASFTEANINIMKKQLKELGLVYDWDREISTSDPKYYKWTQFIFIMLYKEGLVKQIDMPVNWCERLGTVLSNDEVIDGKSERGGYPVIRKMMKQWIIDLPLYADSLLEGLKDINWPLSTKEIQKNWIGKSVGAEIVFKTNEYDFKVFTTRADTLFGATYVVLSPEHDLVDKITTSEYKEKIKQYQKNAALKSELERTDLNKEKTGEFTGAYAVNPVNEKKVPIYISDYVLSSYGSGAIMAVPAHDERDYEFALKYNLEIIPVVENNELPYIGDGKHINSGFINGLYNEEANTKVINYLKEKNKAEKKVNYKVREWIFARQRYWGEPIPVLHYGDKKEILKKEDLPLILPELEDYKPGKDGTSPLVKNKEWVNYKGGKRETSTMPGSAGSSWYFLRYLDPHNENEIADPKLINHWMPVDLYVGGPEHAVGHLLYSRMWNQFLYKKGITNHKEPFNKLVHQGMILGSNNVKMGKRHPKYVVNPSDIVKNYGADTLRLYEMFMGPLESDKPWNDNALIGAHKFLERVYRLYHSDKISDKENKNLEVIYNQTVKKVEDDYESLNINTAISQMMIFINSVYKEDIFPKDYAVNFLKLLNPVAPFITEELNKEIFNNDIIASSNWPKYDINKLEDKNITIAVQVNGKLRGTIDANKEMTKQELIEKSKQNENVLKHLEGKEIIKQIVVPGKIVNFLIK